MLSFREQFRSEPGVRFVSAISSSEVLVFGQIASHYGFHRLTVQGTSVQLISFIDQVEMVNADMSEDNQYLHFCEKFSRDIFQSVLIHLETGQQIKRREKHPIAMHFLPQNEVFQLIGERFSHMKVYINKRDKSLKLEKAGRIDLPSMLWSEFDPITRIFCGVFERGDGSQIVVVEPGAAPRCLRLARLPPLQAVVPPGKLTRASLINRSVFSLHWRNRGALVVHLKDVSFCSFWISAWPGGRNQKVEVRNTPADVPVCVTVIEGMVFVFVSHCFLFCADIKLKHHALLMGAHLDMFSGPICLSIPFKNWGYVASTTDSEGFRLCEVGLNFRKVAGGMLRVPRGLKTQLFHNFAFVVSRTRNPSHFGQCLARLVHLSSGSGICIQRAVSFIFDLFAFLNRVSGPLTEKIILEHHLPKGTHQEIADLERGFPSADGVSRRTRFRQIAHVLFRSDEPVSRLATRVLTVMRKQNEVAQFFRDGLDFWIWNAKPREAAEERQRGEFVRSLVGAVVDLGSIWSRMPAVPSLRDDLLSSSPIGQKAPEAVRPRNLQDPSDFQLPRDLWIPDVAKAKLTVVGLPWHWTLPTPATQASKRFWNTHVQSQTHSATESEESSQSSPQMSGPMSVEDAPLRAVRRSFSNIHVPGSMPVRHLASVPEGMVPRRILWDS